MSGIFDIFSQTLFPQSTRKNRVFWVGDDRYDLSLDRLYDSDKTERFIRSVLFPHLENMSEDKYRRTVLELMDDPQVDLNARIVKGDQDPAFGLPFFLCVASSGLPFIVKAMQSMTSVDIGTTFQDKTLLMLFAEASQVRVARTKKDHIQETGEILHSLLCDARFEIQDVDLPFTQKNLKATDRADFLARFGDRRAGVVFRDYASLLLDHRQKIVVEKNQALVETGFIKILDSLHTAAVHHDPDLKWYRTTDSAQRIYAAQNIHKLMMKNYKSYLLDFDGNHYCQEVLDFHKLKMFSKDSFLKRPVSDHETMMSCYQVVKQIYGQARDVIVAKQKLSKAQAAAMDAIALRSAEAFFGAMYDMKSPLRPPSGFHDKKIVYTVSSTVV